MEKPTTKLSAPDCVILFCVATGIHHGSVGMRRVPNHLFLEELTMQSDWTYFGELAALILFVYYLLDSRLSRIGDHILEIRRIVEKWQPKS